MYYRPNSYTTDADCEWAGGTILRQQKKVPPAHMQRVYLEECSEGSSHRINVSVRESVRPSAHLSVRPEYGNT
jgi:hypothetical protein